jgi:pimeloyl-ACP methyl ester carboxylesterase
MPIARLEGIDINYKVEGQGEPLILIAGFSAQGNSFIGQVRDFRKHFRVITFDNRGIGKTSKPLGPYSTRMMADDIIKLMDYLKIKNAHIVGTSMGGMIAQELAISYPERILKLVLAYTYACQDGVSGDAPEQAVLKDLAPSKKAVAMIGLAFNKPLYRYTYGLLAILLTRFASAADAVGISGQNDACRSHNTVDRLSAIAAPTLVIVGTRDRIINPLSSEVIADKIGGSQLIKIEGGSHALSMEWKQTFNRAVLGFLANHT